MNWPWEDCDRATICLLLTGGQDRVSQVVGGISSPEKMSAITSASRFCQSKRIIKQEAGGTTVLLSLEGGRYYSLEGVGGRAWELADGSRTVSEIALLLESEFDAPVGVIERDLIGLFSDLADEKLVAQDQEKNGGI
jgi:hypothetical protein